MNRANLMLYWLLARLPREIVAGGIALILAVAIVSICGVAVVIALAFIEALVNAIGAVPAVIFFVCLLFVVIGTGAFYTDILRDLPERKKKGVDDEQA